MLPPPRPNRRPPSLTRRRRSTRTSSSSDLAATAAISTMVLGSTASEVVDHAPVPRPRRSLELARVDRVRRRRIHDGALGRGGLLDLADLRRPPRRRRDRRPDLGPGRRRLRVRPPRPGRGQLRDVRRRGPRGDRPRVGDRRHARPRVRPRRLSGRARGPAADEIVRFATEHARRARSSSAPAATPASPGCSWAPSRGTCCSTHPARCWSRVLREASSVARRRHQSTDPAARSPPHRMR